VKKYYPVLFFLFIGLILPGCSNDDDSVNILTNIEGTVNGPVSCGTEDGSPAMGIAPDNIEFTSGLIITATLPEEFHQEGLRINFDMKPSKKNITICTANFAPEQFYEVFNVTVFPGEN